MPSYLDFGSTKSFRDFIINKTLTDPTGPQNFTANTYIVQKTSDMSNVDPGAVDTNRNADLLTSQTANVFKPLTYDVTEYFDTIPRKANLSLYPYFVWNQGYTMVGLMGNSTYETESELMRFAAWNMKENKQGPVWGRLSQNLYTTTAGKVRLLDALQGNTTTALNILTGREPLIEMNTKITVGKTIIRKAVDFLQTVAGVEFPWSEIPGDYLSNPNNPINNARPQTAGNVFKDAIGAIGSMIGIERRATTTKKPSDLFIEYLGARQKSFLYNNLSYSKFGPNYTTVARSQNTSKVFNFVDQFAESVKNTLGIEAPVMDAYIGDDRGNDAKYAMNDFNDRPVRGSYYMGMMFDPIQTQLFERQKNIGESGGIGGKLTWISSSSKNKLGANNQEFTSEQLQYEDSLSKNYIFGVNSLLHKTQDILETLPTDGGISRSHVANVIDQTSRIFRDGDVMISRGSAIKYVNQFTNAESGVEYCRVWTKDRSYMNYSDTMKRTDLIRKFNSSISSTPWNLNIYPNSNGNSGFDGSTNIVKGMGDGFYAKKYMFSIENLAWKTSNTPGFTYNDLPYCERGPNGGRIMWFPPYDLKVNEVNNARWEGNSFLGRPEPVYTYQNTERTGTISFKVVVDHPSILNLLVREHFKGMSDEEADNYINAFFAGCQDVDFYGLIRKYTTLTQDDVAAIQSYLNQGKDPNTIKRYKTLINPPEDSVTPKNSSSTQSLFIGEIYFKNDVPFQSSDKYYTDKGFESLYNEYISGKDAYISELNTGLNKLKSTAGWSVSQQHDYASLTFNPVLKTTRPTDSEFYQLFGQVNKVVIDGFNELQIVYTDLKEKLSGLKDQINNKSVSDINLTLGSRTSSVADEKYNLDLSFRRSYSIIIDILNKLAKDGYTINTSKVTWPSLPSTADKTFEEVGMKIALKDLGYEDQDGNITIDYVRNTGEQEITNRLDCSDKYSFNIAELKKTAPITFKCRETSIDLKYTTKSPDQPAATAPVSIPQPIEITDTPTRTNTQPPIDEMKKIIMKTLSECYYFKKLEEESPLQFSSLKEKLRYFHPAFHSTTPEGLNARLTFLNQCVRPGDTIPVKGIADIVDLNARNTTFGPPPICVLRIGDFYHSKIVIDNINIEMEQSLWDLNPEGIGVQPMLANVTLQIKFIGGHGLERPVERLQNALSSNFYANTEIYDPRSTATEDRTKFTKEFLEDLVKNPNMKTNSNTTSQDKPTINITNGQYIGTYGMTSVQPPVSILIYGGNSGPSQQNASLIENVFTQTKSYISSLISGYNTIYTKYDSVLSSIFLSPVYRTIKDYTVQTDSGTRTIQLLGEYKKGAELEVLTSDFKIKILDKITNSNISTIFGFNKDMSASLLKSSEDILKPAILSTISMKVDKFTQNPDLDNAIKGRNQLIVVLDKLNFIVETLHDGKMSGSTATVGVNFTGFTNDKLYNEYKTAIDFINNNQNKFTENLDTSTYVFNRMTIMTTDNLSYFLSILLKDQKEVILDLYRKDSINYNDRIISNIDKRLTKFLSSNPSKKDLIPEIVDNKYPSRKNDNVISFVIGDESYVFTEQQVEQLKNVHRTSGNKTRDVLNYYR